MISPLASSVCIAALLQPSDAFTQHLMGCRRGRRCKEQVDARATRLADGAAYYGDQSLLEVPALGIDANYNNPATQPIDRRPHEQRVSGQRKARRLNHPFQHLYRHSDPRFDDNEWNETVAISDEVHEFYTNAFSIDYSTLNGHACKQHQRHNSTFAQQPIDVKTSLLAIQYLHLHGGYTFDEIHRMQNNFPPLLEMDVIRHLRPKMRFLKDCLGGGTATGSLLNPRLRAVLPASFFGTRFERTIAPRHAFLVHIGLPSGKALWDGTYQTQSSSNRRGGTTSLLEEFLMMHRQPKKFAAMCNSWRQLYGSKVRTDHLPITKDEIVAFDKLFQRGILSAARDDSAQIFLGSGNAEGQNTGNSPSLLQTANVTSALLVRYMIQHGANPWETDVRGASLFHWAAGCGNLGGFKELVNGCNLLGSRLQGTDSTSESENPINPGVHAALLWKASRDGATPLHWAVAGAGPKEFGIGGHIEVCRYLLALCSEYSIISERKLINSETKDGNSILMWSAWSRSLDIVKLLVRNRADTTSSNRNGCTVAHWAASGGDLSVCKYLHDMAHVDYSVENFAGNTPLSHSVAYQRFEVTKWLREDLHVDDKGGKAEDLALDFVNWADMGVGLTNEDDEMERRSVYSLFNSFKDWSREEIGEIDSSKEL